MAQIFSAMDIELLELAVASLPSEWRGEGNDLLKKVKANPSLEAEAYNEAFDPADECLGGAFKDGFREGWLFAKDPGFDNREELEGDYGHSVDIAPSECWDAYRSHYFAMLPLDAMPKENQP